MRLRDCISAALGKNSSKARIKGPKAEFFLRDLIIHQVLSGPPSTYAAKSVLLLTKHQLSAAAALVALDGLARRIVLCPPDLKPEHLTGVLALAEIDLIVSDQSQQVADVPVLQIQAPSASKSWQDVALVSSTQWALFTSGTTGQPKLVIHTLEGLTGAIHGSASDARTVWATFYDIRRYGGLQILLRAFLGGTDLVVTEAGEPTSDYIDRLKTAGVTHLTGTPTHWRHALLSPNISNLELAYARLSGEIADQPILDRLQAAFPTAKVGHAYASTEAGVGFEVTDGLEGFPLAFLHRADSPVALKIVDDVLLVRSMRTASQYLGVDAPSLLDDDGYVYTDDLVEIRRTPDSHERCLFMGRKSGLINVGGLKVHPAEVENVINRHPAVDVSRVYGRRSPVTGALVVADVLLRLDAPGNDALKSEIFEECRRTLGVAKTPVKITFVESLDVTPGGKMERYNG